ncbi:hypothetical protein ACOMHN_060516 [Nucella lapillus]
MLRITRDTWRSVNKNYTGVVSHKVEAEVVYKCLGRMERDWEGHCVQNHTLNAEQEVDTSAEERVGIPFRRGTIKCRLTARDTIGLVGRHLPLLVHIDNGSFKDLRNISLALYKLKVKWVLRSLKTDVTINLGSTYIQPLPILPPSGLEQHVIL